MHGQTNTGQYSSDRARLYASIGIEGSTFEIGFDRVCELLEDIDGKQFLDFGCGAGRSSAFLRSLGAASVVAVDHDPNMITTATSRSLSGVKFLLIARRTEIPSVTSLGAEASVLCEKLSATPLAVSALMTQVPDQLTAADVKAGLAELEHHQLIFQDDDRVVGLVLPSVPADVHQPIERKWAVV